MNNLVIIEIYPHYLYMYADDIWLYNTCSTLQSEFGQNTEHTTSNKSHIIIYKYNFSTKLISED